MPLRPPKLAEQLLRCLVGGRDADAVSGDLRETFEERGGGRLWYWRQAASCVAVRLSPGRRMLPGLGADFHYALRLIRRNPGYALTAMLCLALAMGVNTTSSAAAPQDVGTNVVEPNYFEMMRVPILKGRGFARTGALTDAPAVVVNETMARTWWPGEDPIGKTLWLGCQGETRKIGQVIGIAGDTRNPAFAAAVRPGYYRSRLQDPGNGYFGLVLHTTGNPYLWAKPLMSIAQGAGPHFRIFEMQSMDDAVGLLLWEAKWQAALLSSLGLLAAVLAAIGLYGVVAYAVSQRTREIGVRMALGAAPGDVQWMVLGHGLRITAAGIVGGLLLSAGAVHLLRSYLYGLSPFDPVAFTGASLKWVIIAMLASWYPSRRATRVDPMAALQYE